MKPSTADRFDSGYVPEPNSGCWLWTKSTSKNGYANFAWDGRQSYAHRYAFGRFVGPIPSGTEIDHLCRVRSCVNPDHLEAVSHRANVLRGTSPSAFAARADKCKAGHEYTAGNTRTAEGGRRVCRECHRLSVADYQRRRPDMVAASGRRHRARVRAKSIQSTNHASQ